MAETKIERTEATWNPVAGCSIATAGCTHCHAMKMARRLEAMDVEKYAELTRKNRRRTVWNGVVREDRAVLAIPCRWRKSRKIFVNSMSDLFHECVSDTFLLHVWQVMRETPRRNHRILTKRPERMATLVANRIKEALHNVWPGTSVENEGAVDRIEYLRKAPAITRFISLGPLIGTVGAVDPKNIQWVIAGGESRRSARPIREEWIDEIHTRCLSTGTAFFFKQWGTWGKDDKKRSKKADGRECRGQMWDEMRGRATNCGVTARGKAGQMVEKRYE